MMRNIAAQYTGSRTTVRHRAAGLRILRSRRSNFWTLRAYPWVACERDLLACQLTEPFQI